MRETNFSLKCEKAGLPGISMDALLELCRQKQPNKSDLDLVSHMRITVAKCYCDNYLAAQSVNDFWILYYMSMSQGLAWDESNLIWIRKPKKC